MLAGIAFQMAFQGQVYAQADGKQTSFKALLKHADIAAGEEASQRCSMCHTFDKGGANRMGPNLWDIVGSPRARLADYNYSDELKSMHNQTWTYEALDQFLANPHKFAPGDKMPFAGIDDPKERADLIAWLRTLSDHPVPLP